MEREPATPRLLLLFGTERLRMYSTASGSPTPVFLPGFDGKNPMLVAAGDRAETLGQRGEGQQPFLLDGILRGGVGEWPPRWLRTFVTQLRGRLADDVFGESPQWPIVLVPPLGARGRRIDALCDLVRGEFQAEVEPVDVRDALIAGLALGKWLHPDVPDRATFFQIISAHITALMRVRVSANEPPTVEACGHTLVGGRHLDRALVEQVCDQLGGPDPTDPDVHLATRALKEALLARTRDLDRPLSRYVELEAGGRAYQGTCRLALDCLEDGAAGGAVLTDIETFLRDHYAREGLLAPESRYAGVKLFCVGGTHRAPRLRALLGEVVERHAPWEFEAEVIAQDAEWVAAGALSIANGRRIDPSLLTPWPDPPPPAPVAPAPSEPEEVNTSADSRAADEPLEPGIEQVIEAEPPPAADASPDGKTSAGSEPARRSRRSGWRALLEGFADATGSARERLRGDSARDRPQGPCPFCEGRDVRWVYRCAHGCVHARENLTATAVCPDHGTRCQLRRSCPTCRKVF